MGIWPKVNEEMCRAWGLNPSEVKRITIVFHPVERPTATVVMMLNEKIMQVILNLVPRNEHLDGMKNGSNDVRGAL